MVDRSNENWESLERKGYYTLTEKDNSFPGASANITLPSALADTGDRTTVGGGAQRDMGGHKGRCDLLPLDTVGYFLKDPFFFEMDNFVRTNDETYLDEALLLFCNKAYKDDMENMFLEVAKQYEDGAVKYSARNWEQEMPIWMFIDSAIRHYLKWRAGWEDEPHDRAVVWNLIGALWTIDNCEGEYEC